MFRPEEFLTYLYKFMALFIQNRIFKISEIISFDVGNVGGPQSIDVSAIVIYNVSNLIFDNSGLCC